MCEFYNASLGFVQFVTHQLHHTQRHVRILADGSRDDLTRNEADLRFLYGCRRGVICSTGNKCAVSNHVARPGKADDLLASVMAFTCDLHVSAVDAKQALRMMAELIEVNISIVGSTGLRCVDRLEF